MSISDSELLINSKDNIIEKKCPICYDNSVSYVNLKCSHQICLSCFMNSINHILVKCPLCRDIIIEAEPILKTFNQLLTDTNTLVTQNEELCSLNSDKNRKISDLMDIIEEKEQKIDEYKNIIKLKDNKMDEYKDLLLESHKNSISLLNKLLKYIIPE